VEEMVGKTMSENVATNIWQKWREAHSQASVIRSSSFHSNHQFTVTVTGAL
jgi:hypothetical protein